jgi:hypothetical protein
MLSVVMLSFVMLSVIILSVIVLSVVAPLRLQGWGQFGSLQIMCVVFLSVHVEKHSSHGRQIS